MGVAEQSWKIGDQKALHVSAIIGLEISKLERMKAYKNRHDLARPKMAGLVPLLHSRAQQLLIPKSLVCFAKNIDNAKKFLSMLDHGDFLLVLWGLKDSPPLNPKPPFQFPSPIFLIQH